MGVASWSGADKEREQKYKRSISKLAQKGAQSTIEKWPERWCDLPQQWFDVLGCRGGVEAYLESISRNIAFKDHILRLEAILNHPETVTTIPPKIPYVFSPQFSVTSQKWAAPSLQDLLMSRRVNVPPPPAPKQLSFGSALPSTSKIGTESNPPPTREDGLSLGLGSLIHELRHSPAESTSLLQVYGEDLSASYNDLLAKGAPFLVQRDVPTREELLKYHDLCSKQKDAIFSELSETLAPSQKAEIVLRLSGLWPRLTPRSILRQLSKDHVHTLTDQWKVTILRYAVVFLKYQQSKRLLELWCSNRHEELIRELDALCECVDVAYSPDWLLIQVSCFPVQLQSSYKYLMPVSSLDRRELFGASIANGNRTRDDISDMSAKRISSAQHGRGKVVRNHTSRCRNVGGRLQPSTNRHSQTII